MGKKRLVKSIVPVAVAAVVVSLVSGGTAMAYTNHKINVAGNTLAETVSSDLQDYLTSYEESQKLLYASGLLSNDDYTLDENDKEMIVQDVVGAIQTDLISDAVSPFQKISEEQLLTLENEIRDRVLEIVKEKGVTELTEAQQVALVDTISAIVKTDLMQVINNSVVNSSDLEKLQNSVTVNINTIQNTLDKYSDDIKSLSSTVTELQSQLSIHLSDMDPDQIHTDIESLTNNYITVSKDIVTLSSGLYKVIDNIEVIENTITNLTKNTNDNLQASVNEINNTIQTLKETDLANLDGRLDQLIVTLNDSVSELRTTINDESSSLQSNIVTVSDSLSETIANYKAGSETADETLKSEMQACIDALNTAIDQAQAEAEDTADVALKAAKQSLAYDLSTQKSALESAISALDNKSEQALDTASNALKASITTVSSDLDATNAKVDSNQSNISTLQTNLGSLRAVVGTATSGLVKAVADNTDAIVDVNTTLTGDINDLQQSSEDADAKIKSDLEAQVESLNKAIAQAQQDAESTADANLKATKEALVNDLTDQKTTLESTISALDSKSSKALEDKSNELSSAISDLDTSLTELKNSTVWVYPNVTQDCTFAKTANESGTGYVQYLVTCPIVKKTSDITINYSQDTSDDVVVDKYTVSDGKVLITLQSTAAPAVIKIDSIMIHN